MLLNNQPQYRVDLPRDVWHSIADFLPDAQLVNLYSVTGAFLQRAANLRYNDIRVDKWEDRLTYELLDHIRIPFCAELVRRLNVKIVETKQFDIDGRSYITASRMNTRTLSWHNVKRQAGTCWDFVFSLLRNPPPTFAETMERLINVMPSLTRITELTIDCWDLDPSYNLQPFLTTAWSSFGHNLTKLSFYGNLDSFHHLSASSPSLPNLSTLEIEITINLYSLNRSIIQERETLEKHIAPFIAAHAHHLQSLSFWFWADLDLSNFFNCFPVLPKLHHLSLRMPYNKPLHDPATLLRFLTTSTPVLRDIQIRLNPTGAALDKSTEMPLAQFLTQLAQEPTGFRDLTALDIFPTHLPEGIPVLFTALSRASRTLNRLCIRDRSLQLSEVIQLVDILAECEDLEMLRFNISKFELEVVDLIYTRLPWLKRLTVFIDESWNFEPSISPKLEEDLASHTFPTWRLQDIGLWKAGTRVDIGLMHAFARSIPSITSFWGDGHMEQDKQCSKIPTKKPKRVATLCERVSARWNIT